MNNAIVAHGRGVTASQTVASKVTHLLQEKNQQHLQAEVTEALLNNKINI